VITKSVISLCVCVTQRSPGRGSRKLFLLIPCLTHSSTLKMDRVRSAEMSVKCRIAQLRDPGDSTFNSTESDCRRVTPRGRTLSSTSRKKKRNTVCGKYFLPNSMINDTGPSLYGPPRETRNFSEDYRKIHR
jgi:hypothetical protein